MNDECPKSAYTRVLRRLSEVNVQFVFDGGQGNLISDGSDRGIKITDSPPLRGLEKFFNVDW